jgi:hypothetical protein
MNVMSSQRLQSGSDAVALEASAGLALACAYSSSDEYEAEVIQVRRKAGAYGSRHHLQTFVAVVLVAAAVVAVFLAI